ncbi:MAG: hypothetical protein JKY29_00220, partial [Gammaproteobacteria bacterium]|nr:hypothetical protein [Gammaproteobacteria bacterium]
NAYVTRFNADVGTKAFRYVAEIGKSVALTMNLQPAEVSKAIAIYRVFHDMQKEGYSIRSDHYSLLEMAISRPRMAADVFGFEPKSSTFSVEGMELFHNLCVEDHCPIRNPKQFREMYKVWKETGKRAVIEVSENASSLDDVSRRAFDREMQKDAENKLQRAKDILDKISIDQIRGTISEQQLVSEIHNLLVAKLIPAVGSDG